VSGTSVGVDDSGAAAGTCVALAATRSEVTVGAGAGVIAADAEVSPAGAEATAAGAEVGADGTGVEDAPGPQPLTTAARQKITGRTTNVRTHK
jgi:hypothetical protein